MTQPDRSDRGEADDVGQVLGHRSRTARNGFARQLPCTPISRTSSVIAMAKTPSLNDSRRTVRQFLCSLPGSISLAHR
jgi:hypothetical protein